MTVDGSDERPLALRDLAQAHSPEIVRAALGRFRRRLLTRGLILVLIAAVGLFLYPRYYRGPEDLSSAIARGRGVDLYRTIRNDPIEATVARVARLSRAEPPLDASVERFGIHLFVRPLTSYPDQQIASFLRPDRAHGVLSVRAESNSYMGDGLDIWIALVAGTSAIDIPFGMARTDNTTRLFTESLVGTVHIDMETLGVPDWSWR
jgi:hypothetical protein